MTAIRILEVTTAEDLAEILPLFREALAAAPTADEDSPDEAAAQHTVLASFGDRDSVVLLGEVGGERGGLLVAGPRSDPFSGRSGCWIRLCYVRPPWRGRGLAGRLVAQAEAILSGRGVESISLELPVQDDAFLSIAERHGYVRLRHWLQKDL